MPLYTWHKVHAGLIEAFRTARVEEAHAGHARHGDLSRRRSSKALDDAQMQTLLVAEHGGLNDSYAETYALTGDPRWLRLAERIRDRRVLDPLADRARHPPRAARQHPDSPS